MAARSGAYQPIPVSQSEAGQQVRLPPGWAGPPRSRRREAYVHDPRLMDNCSLALPTRSGRSCGHVHRLKADGRLSSAQAVVNGASLEGRVLTFYACIGRTTSAPRCRRSAAARGSDFSAILRQRWATSVIRVTPKRPRRAQSSRNWPSLRLHTPEPTSTPDAALRARCVRTTRG
jgi:hypothetical protein